MIGLRELKPGAPFMLATPSPFGHPEYKNLRFVRLESSFGGQHPDGHTVEFEPTTQVHQLPKSEIEPRLYYDEKGNLFVGDTGLVMEESVHAKRTKLKEQVCAWLDRMFEQGDVGYEHLRGTRRVPDPQNPSRTKLEPDGRESLTLHSCVDASGLQALRRETIDHG